MALLNQCGPGWVQWIVTAKNFGLQEENINFSNSQGNTTNLENGMGYYRKREKEGERERELDRRRERGWQDAELYEKRG